MSFFTSLVNKITYQINKAVSDPEAEAYAAAQAKQAQQDAAVAANKANKEEKDEAKARQEMVAAREAEAEAKATAKAALLNKLGITAEEAVLLLS